MVPGTTWATTWLFYNHSGRLGKATRACLAAELHYLSHRGLAVDTLARAVGVSKAYIYEAIQLLPEERLAVVRGERPLVLRKTRPWTARLESLETEVGIEAIFDWARWKKAMTLPPAFEHAA